ncbi:MAG: phosphatase PAP2 family protein [Rhodobacteraceae bacterium]|nr:phosphatase PAP2 family protein [Paracoccaceae bacterium]
MSTVTDVGQADFEHAGGDSSYLIGDALIVQRDGLVPSGAITGMPGTDVTKDGPGRMMRLSPIERASVIQSELIEDMDVAIDPKSKSVALSVRTTAKGHPYAPLASTARPGIKDFERDAAIVASYADLRDDRLPEIYLQVDDQLSFFGSVTPLQPTGFQRTLEMLSAALDFATMLTQRVKLGLGCPRPELFSPLIQPVIQTPSHGAFPSGHSTQAHLVAELLTHLRFPKHAAAPLGGKADEQVLQLYRQAARIAINRTVAGVHYPSDSAAGALLGVAFARLLVARAKNALKKSGTKDTTAAGYSFDGAKYVSTADDGTALTRDYHTGELAKLLSGKDDSAPPCKAFSPRPAPHFAVLWKKAEDEWKNRWG